MICMAFSMNQSINLLYSSIQFHFKRQTMPSSIKIAISHICTHARACTRTMLSTMTKRQKREQYKSQWNRKRCYTNSEHWCCVDCYTQFTAFYSFSFVFFFSLSFDSKFICVFTRCCYWSSANRHLFSFITSPPFHTFVSKPILALWALISVFYF